MADLSPSQAHRAIDLFLERYGEGDVKLFGGEPLLAPSTVDAVIRRVALHPSLRLYLSTNGMFLDDLMFQVLEAHPDVVLTVSLDGSREDHTRLRRPLHSREGSGWDEVYSHLPRLMRRRRFVVTQTISPATARRGAKNFQALRELGVQKFNLLPGYYLPWSPSQRDDLVRSFSAIGELVEAAWEAGEPLYLRNLFTQAPTPFFNTGMVVDCDGSIYPSNLILASAFEGVKQRTARGSLEDPPSQQALEEAAAQTPKILEEILPEHILDATRFVDGALTSLCERLFPRWVALRHLPRLRTVA